MLALIVIMILVIVLGGVASYQMYMINQTQNLVIQSQKNQSSVALWKTLLISKSKAVGDSNEIVLPFGENKTGYHTLPSWIYFNTKNPWGKDFIYCPFGPITTGTLDVNIPLSTTTNYQVRIKNNFATEFDGGQRDYVVASTYNGISDKILAFIISPIPSSTNTLPNCSDISFDSALNAYKVDNGLVEAITTGDIETYSNLSRLAGQDNGISNGVSYINTVMTDDSVDGNTLTENFNYIASSDFKYVHLKLPPNESNLDSVIFNDGSDEFEESERTFILEGDESGTTTINSDSVSNIVFNNYRVILKNVKFESNIVPTFFNSKLSTENVQLANVILKESVWKVNGTNDVIIASNNMPLSLKAGLVLFKSELFIPQGKKLTVFEHNLNNFSIGAENSEINVENGELSIMKATNKVSITLLNSLFNLKDSILAVSASLPYESDILLDEFSKLSVNNSDMNVSGRAVGSIINKGYAIINNSSLNTFSGGNYGIVLQSNANLILKANADITQIGSITPANRPVVAVLDETVDGGTYVGGKGVSGGSVQLYATNSCVYGPIFAYSEELKQPAPVAPYRSINEFTGVITEVQLFASKLNNSNWNCTK